MSDRHEVAARRQVFGQLVESLLFEGAIQPKVDETIDGLLAYRLDGTDAGGAPVSYEWLCERTFSFDRLRRRSEFVTRTTADGAAEALSPGAFLAEIGDGLRADPDRRHRFAGELGRTIANDAQARTHWSRQAQPAAGASCQELESLVIDGHRYHPAYKSRIGFDEDDNARFGPEFAQPLRPLWAALHRDVSRVSHLPGQPPDAFLRAELGVETMTRFETALAGAGHSPADYRLLPVHPWQWRALVTGSGVPGSAGTGSGGVGPGLVADGALVPLGSAPDEYRAQQSIRTLANVSRPERASLKLALGIVNTSTARTLAPHTVANAPLVTDWLRRIVAADGYLNGELRPALLGEVLGVAYDPSASTPNSTSGAPAGALAAIWRESITAHLWPGERAAPFTALTHVDATGRGFIEPWIESHGIEAWVGQLLDVTLPPVLHFLLGHGVALEAHAQNLILISDAAGRPARLGLRDFHDGIRFTPTHLADPGGRPPLEATPAAHFAVNRNSYLEAETATDVRDFVLDCLLFVNLAELAWFLADRFGFAERRFWALARAAVDDYHRRFGYPGGRAVAFDVLAPIIGIEQLTTRRLLPDTTVRTQPAPNPLAALTPCAPPDPLAAVAAGSPFRPPIAESAIAAVLAAGQSAAGEHTPVCAFVYDLDLLRAHARQAVAALPAGAELFYAVKANSERPVLEALAGIVAGFEVGSAGEIELARAAAPDAPIVFGGPAKTDADLEAAIRHRVAAVHVESVHELQRANHVAGRLGATLPVALRVNLAGPLPAATLAMAGRPTQFGIDEADLPAAVAVLARCGHLEPAGLHFHSLSNNLDAAAHAALVAGYLDRAAAWSARLGGDIGWPVPVVNAGGGIGVDYAALDRPFDWPAFCARLGAHLHPRPHGGPAAPSATGPAPRSAAVGASTPTVRFECGRFLTAAAGAYVVEVLDLKTNHGTTFAVVRGGTHHFRLPVSWQHSHPFTVVPVDRWVYPWPRPEVRHTDITVTGELCTPKDVLATAAPVGRLRVGDLLWFHHAGAYGWSISHHDFLHHPHPAFVYLR